MRIFDGKKVLIFEGITGSGKSTQIQNVAEIVRKEFGCNISIANSDSPVYRASKDYRKFLVDQGNPIIPSILIHQSTNYLKIGNLPQKSDLVIVDRFVLSNLVYLTAQCDLEGAELDSAIVRDQLLKPFGIDVLKGTTTIYFDVDPALAERRIVDRQQKDSYDNKRNKFNLSLQSKAKERYIQELDHAKKQGSFDFVFIDGNDNTEEVTKQLIYVVREKLKK